MRMGKKRQQKSIQPMSLTGGYHHE